MSMLINVKRALVWFSRHTVPTEFVKGKSMELVPGEKGVITEMTCLSSNSLELWFGEDRVSVEGVSSIVFWEMPMNEKEKPDGVEL